MGWEDLPPTLDLNVDGDSFVHMDPRHYQCLFDYYGRCYSNLCTIDNLDSTKIPVSDIIRKTKTIQLLGQTFTSLESPRTFRGAHIQAYHCPNGSFSSKTSILRPGVVQYYLTHKINLVWDDSQEDPPISNNASNMETYTHIFAFVCWYDAVSIQPPTYVDAGMTVWKDRFLDLDHTCLVPIHRIHSPVAISRWLDDCIVSIPLPRKIAG